MRASSNESPSEASGSRLTLLAAGLVVIWCAAAWVWLRPPSLVEDWMGWRQADTQTIARHLADASSTILYPRIDWGGSGPGYVETELQLYPAMIAPLLRLLGDVEWPGQILSLGFVGAAAWVMFGMLRERHGARAALVGAGVFLCVPSVVLVSTKVQPEALCLLLFVLAWRSFLRYSSSGQLRDLCAYAVFGALAMLVKPTAAQLGIASFVALWLGNRERLRTAYPWVAWGSMLLVLGAFLAHGTSIYHQYGNTFGVLAGGDTKLPKLRHLIMPGTYRALLQTNLIWGMGALGGLSVLLRLLQKKLTAPEWGLLAAMAVWSLVACRYVCVVSIGGSHYVVLGSVLAAHAAAGLATDVDLLGRLRNWKVPLAGSLVVAATIVTFAVERHAAVPSADDRQSIELGRELSRVAAPGELVVVRSAVRSFDEFWGAPLNFEDPRPFYLSRTHGWVLPADEPSPERLERDVEKGARYYVEPATDKVLGTLEVWLQAHAILVTRTADGGRVFRLKPRELT